MKLYRAFATVGGLTLASRVLGFLRDIFLAALLGAGPVAEAFVVAFRFPNLFRRWFGEGAFNAAFVPLFAKRLEGEGRQAARAFASEAACGLAFVLALLSAVAMLAMPWLMYGLAPGFAADPAKYDLSVTMATIAFPYLFCMSMVALLSGVLNSLGKFVESSAVSIALNLTLIAAMGIAVALGYGNDRGGGLVMAWGIFAAGLLQLALLVDGARRNGLLPRLQWPRLTDDMRRLVSLGIPGLIAGGATQINIVIGGIIASWQAGAVPWLYYADRLYELPLAIVGIAIGVVLLPEVSRQLRAGDTAAVLDSQNRSLEFALLLTVPAAVALAVIPHELVSVLFQRGAFRPDDTVQVARAVALFALGLPAFVLIKVLSPAYFAREDTATPMRYATASLAVNTVGSIALFVLFRRLGWSPHLGIAIATSIGGWVNAGLLWRTLVRREHFAADARLRRSLAMILAASAIMGLALVLLAQGGLASWMAATATLGWRSAGLGVLIVAGGAAYFATLIVSGTLEPAKLARLLRRRG